MNTFFSLNKVCTKQDDSYPSRKNFSTEMEGTFCGHSLALLFPSSFKMYFF